MIFILEKIKYIASSVIWFSFMACFNTAPTANRPADFRIEYSAMHGRLPTMDTESIVILSGECSYKSRYKSLVSEYFFKAVPSKLDVLYKNLQDRDFQEIKSDFSKTMDRGGVTIKIIFEGRTCVLSNSMSRYIKKEDAKRFNEIVRLVEDFAADGLRDQELSAGIVIDDRLKLDKLIMVHLNRKLIYSGFVKSGKVPSVFKGKFSYLPGKYFLEIYINNGYMVNKGLIDLVKGIKRINISIIDKKIGWKVIR